jgi:hypothetical protein
VPVVYHQLHGAQGVCAGVPCNSLEFKEVHGQNQNTYRPCPHHCAICRFAPMSAYSGELTIEEATEEAVMQRMRQNTALAAVVLMSLAVAFAGCGAGTQVPPTTPVSVPQNVSINGQYNLMLTSTNGRGTTNIYTDFTQTGTVFTGAANTLVCPSNDLSQCIGDNAPVISIAPSGTVDGTSVKIVVSFPSVAGADTLTMAGSATGTSLAGTFTDSLGDSGTWTAFAALHPFAPPPAVYDYSGTFNSTSNPLLIAPTIAIQLGQNASSPGSSNVTGTATIMHSPCISSLTLSGLAIGDAFSLTDAASKASILALPTLPPGTGNSFNFSYKFEPTAPSCAGDSGRGTLTINGSPFDY